MERTIDQRNRPARISTRCPVQPSKPFFHLSSTRDRSTTRCSGFYRERRKVCRIGLARVLPFYVYVCARERETRAATDCAKRLNLWNEYNGYPFSMPRRGIQCAAGCACNTSRPSVRLLRLIVTALHMYARRTGACDDPLNRLTPNRKTRYRKIQ